MIMTSTGLLTVVTEFAFYGNFADHEIEYVTYFGYKSVRNASKLYSISIRPIDLVCPQAILSGGDGVIPFRSDYVPNILSSYRNNTQFYKELNGKQAGGGFTCFLKSFLKYGPGNLKVIDITENGSLTRY